MTREEEMKRLLVWKETLWGMWEEGMRMGRHPVSVATMKAAFYAAFDSGRESTVIVPKATKPKKRRK